MTAENNFDDLYPDLAKVGGVTNALQLALRLISSPLEVTGKGVARVEKNHRFSQVYTAVKVRLFIYDFWDRGVMLADASTPDLLQVARSIHAWVLEKANTSQIMESFPFVTPEPIAESFEKDMEVEWKWEALEETVRAQPHMAKLLPLVVASRSSKEVRQLFPYTSLVSLHLSRCTGYPFSGDCPYAVPTQEGQYQVFDASGKVVGIGDAGHAVQLLIDHLPPNWGPATKGTADDL
jgi:hypothetical protein